MFLILLLIWGFFIPVHASETAILTLNDAVHEAMQYNADIIAAQSQADAAHYRIPQAKALEDPMVGVMFWNVPRDTANIKNGEEIDYRIEQKIPFPGKRHLRGKSARFDANMEKHLANSKIADVILDVKETYYAVYKLEQQKKVNKEIQNLLSVLVSSTQVWYAANQTTTDTPLKAQIELTKVKNEALLLAQEETTHLSHLSALLGRKSHAHEILLPQKIDIPNLDSLDLTQNGLVEKSIHQRPDIQAMRSAEDREKARLALARTNLIPDFSLAFQYNQTRDMPDTWTGSAMINFPFLFLGKRHAEIQEAKANLKAAQAERASMEIHQQHDIDEAYSTAKTAQKILTSYTQDLIPQARLTYESAQESYTNKKIDFMSLLDAARTYRDVEMDHYEQEALYGTSIAKLERIMGQNLTSLERGDHYE